MRAAIDAAGRIVIPKPMRDEAGLGPDVTVDIRVEGGRIILEGVPAEVTLARRGRFLVAEHASAPTLSTAAVEQTQRALRTERDGKAR